MLKVEIITQGLGDGNIAVDVHFSGTASIYEVHATKTYVENQLGQELRDHISKEHQTEFDNLDSNLTSIIPLGDKTCLH